ncbi:LOW QUALITY PROTEIN: T-complex protein 11 homolog [Theristicus caerulescens]
MNELQQIPDDIYKLTIVHATVLNSDFKLQAPSFSPKSLENRVKETLHKAFWDSLEEQLSASPPDYTRAIQLLQETKEALLSLLLPRHNQLRSQVEEALDMELTRQEAGREALDIHGLTTVLGTVARLRAPIRDEEVQGLQSLTDSAQLLREIFRVLGLMKMDMLNSTIQSLRTHQDHTVQYEWKKFQELLDRLPSKSEGKGEENCCFYRRCLRLPNAHPLQPAPGSHKRVAVQSSGRSVRVLFTAATPPCRRQLTCHTHAGAVSSGTTVPSLTSVLIRGYINLLCWEPGQKEYPETLFMDQAPPQEVQAQVNQHVTAAVLLVTTGTCGSTLCGSPGFVARLKQVTKALEGLSCIRWVTLSFLFQEENSECQEVSRTLSQLGYAAFTTEKCASLKGQIKSIADKGNAVRHVIEQRIHSFLSLFISPDGQNSQKDFPEGLDPIQEELLEAGRRFGSVIHHNRQGFGPYYSGILKKMLLPDAEPDSDAGTDSF